jgi:hypothetical protein
MLAAYNDPKESLYLKMGDKVFGRIRTNQQMILRSDDDARQIRRLFFGLANALELGSLNIGWVLNGHSNNARLKCGDKEAVQIIVNRVMNGQKRQDRSQFALRAKIFEIGPRHSFLGLEALDRDLDICNRSSRLCLQINLPLNFELESLRRQLILIDFVNGTVLNKSLLAV